MALVRVVDRERVRAFWRGHSEAWRLSGLTQREYCLLDGISLKNFGNWRGQLKREATAGHRARWGRYPKLRQVPSPVASQVAKKREKPKPLAPPTQQCEWLDALVKSKHCFTSIFSAFPTMIPLSTIASSTGLGLTCA
jgi:hypothetical protein